jgi:hypothetical protein
MLNGSREAPQPGGKARQNGADEAGPKRFSSQAIEPGGTRNRNGVKHFGRRSKTANDLGRPVLRVLPTWQA